MIQIINMIIIRLMNQATNLNLDWMKSILNQIFNIKYKDEVG
jgi:hypothetical protein